jgi:hypothetical protein
MAGEREVDFDPYRKWLGIPKKHQPPTYYQLLGLTDGEFEPEVIEEAAIRQTTHVRAYQSGPNRDICANLLKEIANARLTLLDPQRRRDYDRKIAVGSKQSEDQVSEKPIKPPLDFTSRDDSSPSPLDMSRSKKMPVSIRKETGPNRGVILGFAIGGGVALFLIVGLWSASS